MKLDKEQVAIRQLDTAIRLLFGRGDVVSIHTLACAAAEVFRGILQAKDGHSWQDAIIETYAGREQEVRRTLARARNFFKHADRDPQETLDFDEVTNDETIIVATLEYGEILRLGAPSGQTKATNPMSIFQLWYFAKDPRFFQEGSNKLGEEIVQRAQCLFPGLTEISREEQLDQGQDALNRFEASRIAV